MVITYTPAQLTAIGQKVLLRECLARNSNTTNNNNNFDLNNASCFTNNSNICITNFNPNIISQYSNNHTNAYHNNQWPVNARNTAQDTPGHRALPSDSGHIAAGGEYDFSTSIDMASLSTPVAEFFRKAQQSQFKIDATKVRRLSEVEAELIGQRDRK